MDVEEFSAEALGERLSLVSEKEKPVSGTLSLRERFRRAMFFQEVSPIPNFEFGYWARTLENWRDQGLPESVKDEASAYEYFGIENWTGVPVDVGPAQVFEPETIEETEDRKVYRDGLGFVAEINKKGDQSIPHFLEFPVKDRETWEPFVDALDPDKDGRLKKLDEAVERLSQSDKPVGISGGSLAGVPRNLLGFERIAVLPYEDPEFFQEIVDTFGHCIVTVLERALPRVQIDFCMGWEDICFNQGPIIGPDVYGAVIGPWYRRIADLLIAHGCCIYTTDCDGNITPLADVFLSHGMNTVFPCEVHAGSDPCALRDTYGKRIRIWGGVDKMILLHGKEAIDRELLRLKPYVEQSGFIPGVDHRVPADVPLDNYKYYLEQKRELFGVGGEPRF
jgi:uroporphyrinogen decarboxylase